jgi:hypothetical protein
MLALVLALALAGTAPAAALGFDLGGRNLDGWHAAWNWLMDVFGWGDEAAGNSGGLSSVYEREGAGADPWGQPQPTAIPTCPGCEQGPDL